MDEPRRTARSTLLRATLLAPLALLAACETTPRAGAIVTAQVLEVPRTRSALRPLHGPLHAAVLAGAGREDVARGRLVLGECAQPDAAAADGVRWQVATTVLPAGVQAPPGTPLDLSDVSAAPGAAGRFHGRFVSIAPPLVPADAVRSRLGDRLHTRCDAGGSGLRMLVRRTIDASELDFARAELRRHQALRDEDLARGRVAVVACQLKVADGGNWYRPAWIARVPQRLDLRPGQVVRLRTGAAEGSPDAEPLAEVIAPDAAAVAEPHAVVRCH